MGRVLAIVVLGRSARNSANIKNRQPIGGMFVQGADLPQSYTDIIASELNVKRFPILRTLPVFRPTR